MKLRAVAARLRRVAARLVPFDAADWQAIGELLVLAVLATGVVAWGAAMVVLVKLIMGVS